MPNINSKNLERRARITVIALFVCLALILTSFAVFIAVNDTGTMAGEEEIRANIENLKLSDTERASVSAYLTDLGIVGFDTLKFKTVENYFKNYSNNALSKDRDIAVSCAEIFLDLYYSKTDLGNRTALTDALLNCYVDAVGDKYASYRTKEEYEEYSSEMSGNFVGIGVRVVFKEDEGNILITDVIKSSPAEAAGFLRGDRIVAVDGALLSDLGYKDTVNSIRGESGTPVTVTVIRDGGQLDITVVRAPVIDISVEYSLDESGIGYIAISSFKANTAEQFRTAVDYMTENGARGIIFDLRDNPGGYLTAVVDMIDYIAPEGARIASYASKSEGEIIYYSDDGYELNLPITVIFNEDTASAGELFSAAMRDYGAMGLLPVRTVGKTTYKKGIMQSTVYLYDLSTLTFTIAYYNPPCDINYDGIGVVPDLEVEWSAEGDPQYDAAYSELVTLINGTN